MPGPLIYHINILDQSENAVLLKYLENKATVLGQCWKEQVSVLLMKQRFKNKN